MLNIALVQGAIERIYMQYFARYAMQKGTKNL